MISLRVRGVRYVLRRKGSGPPLVLLHGFMGSGLDWSRFQRIWAPRLESFAVDLLGHGRSSAPSQAARYRMEEAVSDLERVLIRLELPRVAVLGYSMGGRLALGFACAHPERVSALVLESASPGLADPVERELRRSVDEALAERIERDGLEAFVRHWESMPLWSSQAALPAQVRRLQRRRRLSHRAAGLAGSLRGLGTGMQPPLHGRLAELRLPVLCIAGGLDDKFVSIARDLTSQLPRGRLLLVPGAGHNVHLERPQEFANAVGAFLQEPKGC